MIKLVIVAWVSGFSGLVVGWWARGAWRRFWNRLPKVEASEVTDEWPVGESEEDREVTEAWNLLPKIDPGAAYVAMSDLVEALPGQREPPEIEAHFTRVKIEAKTRSSIPFTGAPPALRVFDVGRDDD